jgi:hypothetical protein
MLLDTCTNQSLHEFHPLSSLRARITVLASEVCTHEVSGGDIQYSLTTRTLPNAKHHDSQYSSLTRSVELTN